MNSGILCTRTMIFLIYNIRGSLLSCLFCLTAPHSKALPYPSQAATVTLGTTSPTHPGTPVPAAPGCISRRLQLLWFVFRLGLSHGGCFPLAVFYAWISCSSPLLSCGVHTFPLSTPPDTPASTAATGEDPTTFVLWRLQELRDSVF